ncbi:DUF429 domain-containing protein [Desulforamulus aeronauticus]|uniref:Predicted nuclease (RNAse H fold) n=1 Tax=Desulforamulus aeronauticus DSM 10349 TaxID=1121421 RepID=A0A1M6Q5F0_9FIRM|nr:Predicted nuclease (RNAse H fold) [Desulforamulus aeronauticus DSM 10349]
MTEKELFTQEDCLQTGYDMPISGRVILLRPSSLPGDQRNAKHQLCYCTGGNGSNPNPIGRSVFTVSLEDGELVRWNRSDVLGIAKPEILSDHARLQLSQIRPTDALDMKSHEPQYSGYCFLPDGRYTSGVWLCSIERYNRIADVLDAHKTADKFIIDIPIGLADSREEAAHRPENTARKILKGKSSSIFPVPFRSVARAKTVADAWNISKALNAGANYMTMGIRDAVNEIDIFLQENETWKNILHESHPEVCFALLNGGNPVMEKKSEEQGIEKRLEILEKYGIDRVDVTQHPLFRKYRDDVVDAVCLALVGRLAVEGRSATVPDADEIKTDATGLKMQMIIPKL